MSVDFRSASPIDFRSASLGALAYNDEFVQRHIGPDAQQTATMLATLGVGSVKELIDKTVPDNIRLKNEDLCDVFMTFIPIW